MFVVLLSWQSHWESSASSFDECARQLNNYLLAKYWQDVVADDVEEAATTLAAIHRLPVIIVTVGFRYSELTRVRLAASSLSDTKPIHFFYV